MSSDSSTPAATLVLIASTGVVAFAFGRWTAPATHAPSIPRVPRAATEGGGHRLNSRCVNHSHTPSLVHNLSKLERVCTLSRLPDTLRSRTHLFAMVAPNDLLGHWLAHYAALGIDFRQRSRVILHTGGVGAEQARAARQLLSEYGVPADLAVNWSSALKMRAAEAYLRSLPPSGYLVWADSDEFMRYPCALAEASRSDKVAVLSSMVERVSLPWRLRPPTPGQRLNASYPRRCLVTACLISEAGVGVATKKPALIPATSQTRLARAPSPHSVTNSEQSVSR